MRVLIKSCKYDIIFKSFFRYTFFDIHGMNEFPKVLLVLGLVVMAISALTKKKFLPYFISAGYMIGFVFGFIFLKKNKKNGYKI